MKKSQYSNCVIVKFWCGIHSSLQLTHYSVIIQFVIHCTAHFLVIKLLFNVDMKPITPVCQVQWSCRGRARHNSRSCGLRSGSRLRVLFSFCYSSCLLRPQSRTKVSAICTVIEFWIEFKRVFGLLNWYDHRYSPRFVKKYRNLIDLLVLL